MTTLYLHIGSNKTATSYLQLRLSRSRSVLKRYGICYPLVGQSGIGAHHSLAAHIRRDPDKLFEAQETYEQILEQLDRNIHQGAGLASSASMEQKVVLSSEMLFHPGRNNTERLEALLALFTTVKVVVYLRRQDHYLPSYYNSIIRNGGTLNTFDKFCENANMDYLKVLNGWSAIVGEDNLIVRPFSKDFLYQGNICSDFLQCIGTPLTEQSLVASGMVNESLPLESLEILRYTNHQRVESPRVFHDFLEKHFRERRGGVSSTLMTEEIYDSIREQYQEKNRQIARLYLKPEFADPLKFPSEFSSQGEAYLPLTTKELSQLAATLWNMHYEGPPKSPIWRRLKSALPPRLKVLAHRYLPIS